MIVPLGTIFIEEIKVKVMRCLTKKDMIFVDPNLVEKNNLLWVEYHQKVELGLEDIKHNRIISKEDLEKEMLDWDND
ncbi:hypothetical protein [Flavobacterium sp. CSZ]|uniref:hypothetical protein n=1 Tax=Flavobacterium sp. CSZ TaxID=2783791 RepID=UPI00188BDB18|nr:hypothetical protein [Flavobacterium sp. CSZ]MBF4486820.1 hypothetical protein [Flavobacterium sp. CSZ]